jgi:hypothetical protein
MVCFYVQLKKMSDSNCFSTVTVSVLKGDTGGGAELYRQGGTVTVRLFFVVPSVSDPHW